MDLARSLTISIATKDRSVVLEQTLRRLLDFGLKSYPLILCDDGSCEHLAPPSLSEFDNVRVLRNEHPRGCAIARNQIAAACETPYILQIDDDSYPVQGSVEELVVWVASQADWLAIALPFEEPNRGRLFSTATPGRDTCEVSGFVACSALINVEVFNQLGGYADWIGVYGEEVELCLRATSSGKRVLRADILRLRHDVTPVSRSMYRITFNSYRNWPLIWLRHAPLGALPIRFTRLLVAAMATSFRTRSAGAIRGLLASLPRMPAAWRSRTPLSMSQFRRFRSLPHALAFASEGNSRAVTALGKPALESSGCRNSAIETRADPPNAGESIGSQTNR